MFPSIKYKIFKNPEFAVLFMLIGGVCVAHSLRVSSHVAPAELLWPTWQLDLTPPQTCDQALVWLKQGTYCANRSTGYHVSN